MPGSRLRRAKPAASSALKPPLVAANEMAAADASSVIKDGAAAASFETPAPGVTTEGTGIADGAACTPLPASAASASSAADESSGKRRKKRGNRKKKGGAGPAGAAAVREREFVSKKIEHC